MKTHATSLRFLSEVGTDIGISGQSHQPQEALTPRPNWWSSGAPRPRAKANAS